MPSLVLYQTERVGDPCILDIAFVVDASGSIEPYWPDVRRFVAGVVDLVNVSSSGSHVALIKFGADSRIEFGFNEGQDKNTVINRVLGLSGPVPFANTQLHKGLNDANDKLFNEVTNTYGYRLESSVRKVRKAALFNFTIVLNKLCFVRFYFKLVLLFVCLLFTETKEIHN